MKKMSRLLATVAVLGLLAGCASTDGEVADDSNDPIEGLNRYIFEVNMGLDKLFLRPLAEIYRVAIPDPVQNVVRKFLDNLRTPVILTNDLLQGEFDRAWDTLARFGINTTVGGLGMFEVADDWGYPKHNEDFGQTLGTWGVDEGFYLMLPLFGPSNPRDAVGRVVDHFMQPLNWFLPGHKGLDLKGLRDDGGPGISMGLTIADALDTRARNIETLDSIEKTSLDFYAAIRSLYRQRRTDEINNGKPTGQTSAPSVVQASRPE